MGPLPGEILRCLLRRKKIKQVEKVSWFVRSNIPPFSAQTSAEIRVLLGELIVYRMGTWSMHTWGSIG